MNRRDFLIGIPAITALSALSAKAEEEHRLHISEDEPAYDLIGKALVFNTEGNRPHQVFYGYQEKGNDNKSIPGVYNVHMPVEEVFIKVKGIINCPHYGHRLYELSVFHRGKWRKHFDSRIPLARNIWSQTYNIIENDGSPCKNLVYVDSLWHPRIFKEGKLVAELKHKLSEHHLRHG